MASLSRPARSAIAPHKQFINSRPATVLIEAGPDGQFIKASSNGKFIKAQWQWRVYQSQSNGSFIKAGFNNAS